MRQLGRTLWGVAVFALLASSAAAATVTLTNGDRVTGEITGIKDGHLLLTTSHIGEVKLDLKAVSSITSEKPLAVYLASGDRLVGPLVPDQKGRVRIESSTGAFTTPISAIRGIARAPAGKDAVSAAIDVLAAAENKKKGKSPWSAQVEFGASFTSGNSVTRGFNAAFNAKRNTPSDLFAFKAQAIYAEENRVRTVNEQLMSFREDIKFPPWYVFSLLAFQRDEFQDLNLRAVFAPGVGRNLIDTDALKAKVELGPSLSYEDYRDRNSEYIFQVRIGFLGEAKVFEHAKITEDLQVFPGFKSGGELRIQSETAFENALTTNLFFKLSLRVDYNTDVLPSVKRLDTKLLASLVLKF